MAEIRKSLEEVVDLCGIDAAKELVAVWGGVKIYIPRSGSNAFMDEVTTKTCNLLCEHFTGEYLDVPKSVTGDPGETRRLAKVLVQDGMSISEVARKLDVTERHIYRLLQNANIKKKKKVDDIQLDLEDYLLQKKN
ncbi:MAG: helix-turn-helix domain-containing protein [Methylocystaceae bacterium]|nr:helix-turn-helix domain-containing protein [Methylocystaceae bacterium]